MCVSQFNTGPLGIWNTERQSNFKTLLDFRCAIRRTYKYGVARTTSWKGLPESEANPEGPELTEEDENRKEDRKKRMSLDDIIPTPRYSHAWSHTIPEAMLSSHLDKWIKCPLCCLKKKSSWHSCSFWCHWHKLWKIVTVKGRAAFWNSFIPSKSSRGASHPQSRSKFSPSVLGFGIKASCLLFHQALPPSVCILRLQTQFPSPLYPPTLCSPQELSQQRWAHSVSIFQDTNMWRPLGPGKMHVLPSVVEMLAACRV